MGKELEPAIQKQLDVMGPLIQSQPDGEYYISDMLPYDQTQSARLFNRLMMELAIRFPDYLWEQRVGFHPQDRGVLVLWRKKFRVTQMPSKKELTDG